MHEWHKLVVWRVRPTSLIKQMVESYLWTRNDLVITVWRFQTQFNMICSF
jgi:hypothetical protein